MGARVFDAGANDRRAVSVTPVFRGCGHPSKPPGALAADVTCEVLGRRWRGVDGANGDELAVLEDAGMVGLRAVVVWPDEIGDALVGPKNTLAK